MKSYRLICKCNIVLCEIRIKNAQIVRKRDGFRGHNHSFWEKKRFWIYPFNSRKKNISFHPEIQLNKCYIQLGILYTKAQLYIKLRYCQ